MTTLIFTPPLQKKDALALEMEKMDSEKTTEDLTNTLKEILALFPREDQDMFVELLKFVPDKQIYDFIKFVDKYAIKDSPMMQMMLLNFFAPFKAKLSALDIAESSGKMYNEIMKKHADEFFGGLEDKLKLFITQFNEAVDTKITELKGLINSHSADMKEHHDYVNDVSKACENAISKINKEKGKAIIDIQNTQSEMMKNKQAFVNETSKEIQKQVLHMVSSWTSWIGGLFLSGIIVITTLLTLFFAKGFHLFG